MINGPTKERRNIMIDLDALYAMNKGQRHTPFICRVCINPHTYITITNFPHTCSCPAYSYPEVRIEKLGQWNITIPYWCNDRENPIFHIKYHGHAFISHYNLMETYPLDTSVIPYIPRQDGFLDSQLIAPESSEIRAAVNIVTDLFYQACNRRDEIWDKMEKEEEI